MHLRVTLGMVLLAAACNASPPGGEEQAVIDAGPEELLPPQIQNPATTPLDTVPIRGTLRQGNRIIITPEEQAGIVGQVVGGAAGGQFCVDVPIEEGETEIEVYAVSDSGLLSPPEAVQVTRDPAVARPANATCSSERNCAEDAVEVCDNDKDDDCDYKKDRCDSDCSGCVDDYFEPNDTASQVPSIAIGEYPDMKICPCGDDWFAFHVGPNARIRASINFSNAEVDLDLKLFRAAEAEAGGAWLAASTTSNDSEAIDYVAVEAGSYYLQIHGFPRPGDSDPVGSYALRIE